MDAARFTSLYKAAANYHPCRDVLDSMRPTGGERERRQTDYNESFTRLRLECRQLECLLLGRSATAESRSQAERRVMEAYGTYKVCRDRLAELLGSVPETDLRRLSNVVRACAGRRPSAAIGT